GSRRARRALRTEGRAHELAGCRGGLVPREGVVRRGRADVRADREGGAALVLAARRRSARGGGGVLLSAVDRAGAVHRGVSGEPRRGGGAGARGVARSAGAVAR